MKRILYFLAVSLLLFLSVSCSKDESALFPARKVLASSVANHRVTPADVRNYIVNFKGVHPTKASEVSVEPIRYKLIEGPVEESRFVGINWSWNGMWDSMLGVPIWHNIFDDWIVGVRVFARKRYIIHNFGVNS